jgi:hypothetical protein
MIKRILALATLLTSLAPAAASAQIRQVSSSSKGGDARSTVNFTIGYFALKGIETRVNDDVLVNDLLNAQPLLFEVNDFNSATFGGEYLFAVNRRVEAGVGLGYSQRSVPSVYANLTHPNGDEIFQELKLKQVPVTFTGRILLLPRGSSVEPYVGGGLVAIRWRYSEAGEFVDSSNNIFSARYTGDGTAAGPMALFGIRGVVQNWTVGAEGRWQKLEGKGLADAGMLGDKIDLGGWHANFTFGFRF